MKKIILLIVTLLWFTLPLVAQDEVGNPIIGYTQYEYFKIMDVFVPADWIEVPITDIYPDLEGGEAGMSFASPDGRIFLDVFRDSVTDTPRDEGGQRQLVEDNFYAVRDVLEDGFADTINGRVFYFDAEVTQESVTYRQIYYILFASEKIYQMIATILPDENGEITDQDIAFSFGLLSNVKIEDKGISGGDPNYIALEGRGFRIVVPEDWEQREPSSESTALSLLQPDDIGIVVLVAGGSYSNPSETFLENTFASNYTDEDDQIIGGEFVVLPLGTAYMGEANSTYESSNSGTILLYNQEYHFLVNGSEYIGIYASVEDEIAEPYKVIFAEMVKTLIPVSGEVVVGGQFD